MQYILLLLNLPILTGFSVVLQIKRVLPAPIYFLFIISILQAFHQLQS